MATEAVHCLWLYVQGWGIDVDTAQSIQGCLWAWLCNRHVPLAQCKWTQIMILILEQVTFWKTHIILCHMTYSLTQTPILSPILSFDIVKKVYTFRKKNVNFFLPYKSSLHYFSCFSTAGAKSWKILCACQEKQDGDLGYS